MRSIFTATGQELSWHQPKGLRRHFELRIGDEVLATLRWETNFGSLATAETAEGRWTFKRVGFWRPKVTVRAAGSDADLAVFEPRWTGSGTLTLASGHSYA